MIGMLNNYHLHQDSRGSDCTRNWFDDKIAIKDKLCATGVTLTCNQQTIKQYQKFVLDGKNSCAKMNDGIGQESAYILKVRD